MALWVVLIRRAAIRLVAERPSDGNRGFQPTVRASQYIPRRGATPEINPTNIVRHIQFLPLQQGVQSIVAPRRMTLGALAVG